MAYKTLSGGDSFKVTSKMKIACCDCGLVHLFETFEDEKGVLRIKVTRDRRATAAIRREATKKAKGENDA